MDIESAASSVDGFFEQVAGVKQQITEIRSATKRIHKINEELAASSDADKDAKLRKELKQIVDSTSSVANRSKATLMGLKKQTDAMKSDPEREGEMRMRTNMHTLLTRKLLEVMEGYQEAQSQYSDQFREKVRRQVQLVQPSATDRAIDVVMQSGDPRSVFRSSALQANPELVNASREAHERHREIVALERSIQELVQLVMDLAVLVQQQGETLDQIEAQVKTAHDRVDAGAHQLTLALDRAKSLRKRQCCLLFIVLAVLLLFTGVLGAIIPSVG